MDTIVLFDPSIRSLNKGDSIIMESAERELENILKDNYIINCATHAPAVTSYQSNNFNPRMVVYHNAKYKFICGSNLIWKNMFVPRPVFNVNILNCLPYKNSILMGIGIKPNAEHVNYYTKLLYKKILSNKFVHSVRDAMAEKFITDLGYKTINTGCPTMWRFTKEFCSDIPKKKAENVIFTLTDYGKDKEADQKLVDILLKNYKTIYFWVQGVFDLEYLQTLNNVQNIQIVSPSLQRYSEILSQPDIEFVGTRLHAGMFAMQHKKRTVILAIDNRVRDLKKTYNINMIERNQIEQLEDYINSDIETNIEIDLVKINTWLSQFE